MLAARAQSAERKEQRVWSPVAERFAGRCVISRQRARKAHLPIADQAGRNRGAANATHGPALRTGLQTRIPPARIAAVLEWPRRSSHTARSALIAARPANQTRRTCRLDDLPPARRSGIGGDRPTDDYRGQVQRRTVVFVVSQGISSAPGVP